MELKVTLEGNKRVATQIGNHLIMTDQPTKHGGDDSAPAPYDLFLASIGTCAGFYIKSYCDNKGIDASGIDIVLSAKRDPGTRPVTTSLKPSPVKTLPVHGVREMHLSPDFQ